ncbi:MAG: hypothetical protein LCH44_06505 [Bacteroidetes bacterium]|jgi:hypothetical protein|nr:hypothetical protein [Bacteroidota bacterium]MCO5277806.1 hypothetical protein [Saprospiraceae bacterium]
MNRIVIILSLCLCFFTSCKANSDNSSDSLKIEMILYSMDSSLSEKEGIEVKRAGLNIYYNVEGYNNKETDREIIDDFMCKNIPDAIADNSFCTVWYIKKSKYTDQAYLQKNPQALYKDGISNHLICTYSWSQGKFYQKEMILDFNNFNSEKTDTLQCD